MGKMFMILVVFLLLLANQCLSQFNTVRVAPMISRADKKSTNRTKPDSSEWMNDWDSTQEVKQTDSIQEENNVNVSLPLKHIIITSGFGYRIHPIDKVMMLHAGIDLKANYEPFYCFADGVVVRTGYDERSGNYVVINHGKLETVYCHVSQIWVKEGDSVSGGQILGITGNTGKTSGPHLHFGMRWEGSPVNPERIIGYVMKHQLI